MENWIIPVFTLIGALVAAAVTLMGFKLKALFDDDKERRRFQRQKVEELLEATFELRDSVADRHNNAQSLMAGGNALDFLKKNPARETKAPINKVLNITYTYLHSFLQKARALEVAYIKFDMHITRTVDFVGKLHHEVSEEKVKTDEQLDAKMQERWIALGDEGAKHYASVLAEIEEILKLAVQESSRLEKPAAASGLTSWLLERL